MPVASWEEIALSESMLFLLQGRRRAWRVYYKGGVFVILSLDEMYKGEKWDHILIARIDREPSWAEIKEVRYSFFPDDVEVFQILPPKNEYVNVFEYCFHLWHKQGERLTPCGWCDGR